MNATFPLAAEIFPPIPNCCFFSIFWITVLFFHLTKVFLMQIPGLKSTRIIPTIPSSLSRWSAFWQASTLRLTSPFLRMILYFPDTLVSFLRSPLFPGSFPGSVKKCSTVSGIPLRIIPVLRLTGSAISRFDKNRYLWLSGRISLDPLLQSWDIILLSLTSSQPNFWQAWLRTGETYSVDEVSSLMRSILSRIPLKEGRTIRFITAAAFFSHELMELF